jgi:hypothetical protein
MARASREVSGAASAVAAMALAVLSSQRRLPDGDRSNCLGMMSVLHRIFGKFCRYSMAT